MDFDVDNHEVVASFIDEKYDGDTFWYTELLDRKTNGASRFKMLRSFEHNDRAQFMEQWPTIKDLCDKNGVRAYTRLSPRSRATVGKAMLLKVTQQVLDGHYDALYHAYNSAKGATNVHGRKLWLFDVDEPGEEADRLFAQLKEMGVARGKIPSRAGYHIITVGFDIRPLPKDWSKWMSLHKDNPTNLYIPVGAK